MDARNVVELIRQISGGDSKFPLGMVAILYKMACDPSRPVTPEMTVKHLGVTDQTAWAYHRRLKNNGWTYRGRLTRKACVAMGLESYSASDRLQDDPPVPFE